MGSAAGVIPVPVGYVKIDLVKKDHGLPASGTVLGGKLDWGGTPIKR